MVQKVQEINSVFKSFKLSAECLNYNEINDYCSYDVKLLGKTRIKDIEKFSNEIGLSLKSPCKPSIKLMPHLGILRLEFCKNFTKSINLFENLPKSPLDGDLQCFLGENTEGKQTWLELGKSPHVLIAGTTGSGKSTLLHTIIANLLFYHKAKICLMDPKCIEFSKYAKLNKDSLYVAEEYVECSKMINALCAVMEQRYFALKDNNVKFPPIVIVIDEFSDLIMQDETKEFYHSLCKLSQKCRAARMHIILSTQRPSVDVISGAIKANFPVRISCKVASGVDSKVILDQTGAESLFGKGDAFIKNNDGKLERFKAAYTTVEQVCEKFK